MKNFDAIIIGSGQAGNPLAHSLADRGWTVALIEKEHLGGSCVNYGCTPTKTMIASAQLAHYARKAPQLGINTGEVSVELKKIVKRKNDMVLQWRGGQQKNKDSRPNITLFKGTASFVSSSVVKVNDEEITSEKIFINTGTRPKVLPILGIEDVPYLTNRNIMDLDEIPEHLIVVGGSYIGLEFGQMFLRFGSKVTVIEYNDRIISREDEEISVSLRQSLEKEGMRIITSAQSTSVLKDNKGILHLVINNRVNGKTEAIRGSHLLIGVGRVPNTYELNLDKVRVKTKNGFINVNEYLETNVPGIYALGDVKGGAAFTNISYSDFQIVYNNLFNDDKLSTKNRIVPYALFTDPELGRVGLTEQDARKAGYNIKVGSIPMSYVARAIERDETDGLMKVIVDADTEQILGAAILGTNGGEVVQTIMAMMYAKASWKILKEAVYVHPTLTEGFFSLFESVK